MVDEGTVYALVLSFSIWLLPIFIREFRSDWQMILAYWFVLTLHQVIAFTNLYWFTTLGSDADAIRFHLAAAEIAKSGEFNIRLGGAFYENILGKLYSLFGISHMLGQQFSLLAFAGSCVVLIKMLSLLKLSYYRVPILLAFGALPSMVFLGSVTLRESYQVLFFMLTTYFGIKMHMKSGVNRGFVFFIISALAMGLFHKALIIFSVFLIILFLMWSLRPTSQLWYIKKLRLLAVFFVPVVLGCIVVLTEMGLSGSAVAMLKNMDVFEAIQRYRDNSPITRASYNVHLDFNSLFTIIYSGFLMYGNYLFTPLPWRIENILDFYAFIEVVLRIVLIYFSVKHWHNSYGSQKRLFGLMLILFFSNSFMWAMGTTNYGTAIRHNLLSWWILVIVGLPPFLERLRAITKTLAVPKTPYTLKTD
jgi:hypothetical protein